MIIKRLKDEVRNNLNEKQTAANEEVTDGSSGGVSEPLVWERRRKSIRRLILGWDQLKKPDKPKLLVEPIAADAVMVAIALKDNGSIITKIKGGSLR